ETESVEQKPPRRMIDHQRTRHPTDHAPKPGADHAEAEERPGPIGPQGLNVIALSKRNQPQIEQKTRRARTGPHGSQRIVTDDWLETGAIDGIPRGSPEPLSTMAYLADRPRAHQSASRRRGIFGNPFHRQLIG